MRKYNSHYVITSYKSPKRMDGNHPSQCNLRLPLSQLLRLYPTHLPQLSLRTPLSQLLRLHPTSHLPQLSLRMPLSQLLRHLQTKRPHGAAG